MGEPKYTLGEISDALDFVSRIYKLMFLFTQPDHALRHQVLLILADWTEQHDDGLTDLGKTYIRRQREAIRGEQRGTGAV